MKLQIPQVQKESITDNKFSTEWFLFFHNVWKRLIGEREIYLGGVINTDISSKGNQGSSITTLMEYVLKGKSLLTSSDFLEIKVFGIFAANANNKSISLEFGGLSIFSIPLTSINDGSFCLDATIIRKSKTSQEIIVKGNGTNPVLIKTEYTFGSQDLETDLSLKLTAEGLSNNDIVQKSLTVKLYKQ